MKSATRKNRPAADVDAYIAAAPTQVRRKLKQVRGIIRAAAPSAEECISYRMPAYKISGKWLTGFAGFKSHVGLYGSVPETCKQELKDKDYEVSKGAVRFPLEKPLPVGLIKKLLQARIKANRRSQ